MIQKRKVVVTGTGSITACGIQKMDFWKAADEGRSCIGSLDALQLKESGLRFGGEVKDFDARRFVKKRKSLKVMSRESQLAVAASVLALEDAGNPVNEANTDRCGVLVGAGVLNNDLDEMGSGVAKALNERGDFDVSLFGAGNFQGLFPLWFLKYLPNMPACHVSINHLLHGPSNTLTTSSSAAALAISEAFRVIERGDADLMLAGGTDSKVNAMAISRFDLMGMLLGKKEYIPFSENATGIVPGEGAGFLCLEAEEAALARGANILAEVSGYGSSASLRGADVLSADADGKESAMKMALRDAGIRAEQLAFVIADGSGLKNQDASEAEALRRVLSSAGDSEKIPVTALKGVAGHLVYASGAVEAAAGIHALNENKLPPVAGLLESPKGLNFVLKESQLVKGDYFMLNSFGFGGQYITLIFKRPEKS